MKVIILVIILIMEKISWLLNCYVGNNTLMNASHWKKKFESRSLVKIFLILLC